VYPSENSLLSWLQTQVLPSSSKASKNVTAKHPQIVITNSGAMRFDIFKGPFTIDTTFLVSPFTSGFRSIASIPYQSANQILRLLNNEGPITLVELMEHSLNNHVDLTDFATSGSHMLSQLAPPNPPIVWPQPAAHREAQAKAQAHTFAQQLLNSVADEKKISGYTTIDDAGSEGDDTVHTPLTFYDVPNCIAANIDIDEGSPPATVDLVYNEFIEQWVLLALRFLGLDYGVKDTQPAMGGKSFTEVISDWVSENWKCEAHD